MDFKLYSPNAFPPSQDLWARIATSTNQADPFCCSPTWQMAFHDAFSPAQRLLIEASDNSVIAFAEHTPTPDEIILAPIESHWFFGCPLLGKHAVELFEERLDGLAKPHAQVFPKFIVSGIRPGGVLFHRLINTFARRFDIFLVSSSVQGAASLKDGLDGYLSRRSANHRKKLRKQARRTAEMGVSYERVCPATIEEAEATYSRIIKVELASWKGINQCGMAESPSIEFYDSMIKRLSTFKGGRVIFARHEGRDIGFIFGGMAARIYRGQQFSYDDNWKHYSIGNLLQVEQVKWLCEEGAKRYDMGPVTGPKMGYKTHWTEKQSQIQTWLFIKR